MAAKRLPLWIGLALMTASTLRAGPLAQFRTPLGDIEVELFEDKPVTTRNFIRYVESGAYSNMFFHRWVPNFVIQGGGFAVTDRGTTDAWCEPVPTYGQILNEYGVGRLVSNTYGTLAMARVGGVTNSATSQWFFNVTNNSFLDAVDGGFTVFGRVVRGTNLLNLFTQPPVTNGIYWYNLGAANSALTQTPLLAVPTTWAQAFNAALFCDITLLNVRIKALSNAGREISWNSVTNRPQVVEWVNTVSGTARPLPWQVLVTTNGTGATMKVTDTDPAAGRRFYRVRVQF